MLVLSRKEGEKIVIDDKVTITVLNIIGNRVKLGIEAPSGVLILRRELREGKQQLPARRRHRP